MVARLGAKLAVSTKLAEIASSESPTPRPMSAVSSGRPAATIAPNMISMMMIAARMPTISLIGGSLEADAITFPVAPAVNRPWLLSCSTAAISAWASAFGTSASGTLNWTLILPMVPVTFVSPNPSASSGFA